jgi:hypothetical protein
MVDIKQIRFVATNYSNLQGLRTFPLGLCLLSVTFWANGTPEKNFVLPFIYLAVSALLLFAIDRYDLRVYGRVQRTPESRRLEWLLEIVGAILAVGSLWLDLTNNLPLSLVGLVFAAGLLADYIRITWLVKGRSLLYYPLGAVLMALMSLLPLLGLPDWWLAFGLRSQIMGICVVIGIFTILAGIWSHNYLVHTLPTLASGEAS